MFSSRGKTISGLRFAPIVAAALMVPSIGLVMVEVEKLGEIAGGVAPLDVHFGYDQHAVVVFAEALGQEGRALYARFQLGVDALAPPAFVCFLMAVYRSTVKSLLVQRGLTVLAFTYFTSVLIANTFMPVIMLEFPDANSSWLPLLYTVIPLMDLVKYVSHGIAWMIILAAWAWQFSEWALARRPLSQSPSEETPNV